MGIIGKLGGAENNIDIHIFAEVLGKRAFWVKTVHCIFKIGIQGSASNENEMFALVQIYGMHRDIR